MNMSVCYSLIKRSCAVVLACSIILFGLTGCASQNAQDSMPTSSQINSVATSSTSTPVSTTSSSRTTNEGLESVEVTFPTLAFEGQDMSAFDPELFAEESGFISAILNEDGSVTAVMTEARRKEVMEGLVVSFDESFAAMVEAEDTPHIKKITHTEDFGTITVDVDRAAYSSAPLEMSHIVLGLSGCLYQGFLGKDPQVEVIIRDSDTGETINSTVFPIETNAE